MADDERLYWIWLAESIGQGSKYASALISRFGSAKKIYETPADELDFGDDFSERAVSMLRGRLSNRSLERAENIAENCSRHGIGIACYGSREYPSPFKELCDAPLVIYSLGKIPPTKDRLFVTMVGTRSMTDYGRRMAYSIGAGLACGGAVVVSGMALGSDSMSLIGALDGGGEVVAVLGSGVDVIYPYEHKDLYYKILERGAVISEYPPESRPLGSHFPVRNRLMSCISDATCVIEAGAGSGALITAQKAVDQGRYIFAVPGQVGEANAEGPNNLIRNGALPATCAEDILEEFEFVYSDTVSVRNAHAGTWRLDAERVSLSAMNRARIGTGHGSNTYGRGSNGGRADENSAESGGNSGDEQKRSERTDKMSGKKKAADTFFAENKPADAPVSEQDTQNKEPEKSTEIKQTQEQTVNSEEKVIQATKIELDMLDENEIKVYNKMKLNVPTLPDELVGPGENIGDVLSALTMLEMAGAVESGSGGYFKRISTEDLLQSRND